MNKTTKDEKKLIGDVIRDKIDTYIGRQGLKMQKQLSSGSYGFLYYSEPTYDNRTVYSYKQAVELSTRGFTIPVNEDLGNLLFNALMQ